MWTSKSAKNNNFYDYRSTGCKTKTIKCLFWIWIYLGMIYQWGKFEETAVTDEWGNQEWES